MFESQRLLADQLCLVGAIDDATGIDELAQILGIVLVDRRCNPRASRR
jgi:hypothetical protein